MKTTIVIESESTEDLDEALKHATVLAKGYVMQMSFSSKKVNGSTVSVRTTKVRRQKAAA